MKDVQKRRDGVIDLTYKDLVDRVLRYGYPVSSRFGNTKEVIGLQLEVPAGTIVTRPGLNRTIGYMEAVQLISGTFDSSAFRRVAPRARLDLFTRHGAYGPRVAAQLEAVVNEISTNPASRQLVLHISSDLDEYSNDYPCTTSIQFLCRRGLVNAIVSMRSWDLIWGAPADLVQFGALTQVVANCVDLRPGVVRVTAGSAHVYNETAHLAPIHRAEGTFTIPRLEEANGGWAARLDAYVSWARACVTDETWLGGPPPGVEETT